MSGLVPFRSHTCREVGVITILHMQKLTLTELRELTYRVKELIQKSPSLYMAELGSNTGVTP